ncbi:MAG: Asp-tRNA(Asn)/Glu-tRNA(Gln) amidotransferase subunit GatA [Bacteroidota bacterium]
MSQTIQQLQLDLANGKYTTSDIVKGYLERAKASLELNIYVELFEEEALATAQAQDAARQKGQRLGALAGVVISIKDVLCYTGHRVSAASKMLDSFVSPYTGTALQRLIDEDAIIIGRTNCDEFAMGSGNENSHYGPTRNAADPSRVPGGSSGGAAVSVQAGTCHMAVGSSTGGSVRQPASFCGLYGFKPTYGRISRHGLIAYGSSFDQIGLIANHPEDIALGIEIMAGPDEWDATAPDVKVPSLVGATGPKKARIAYFPGLMDGDKLDPALSEAIEQAKDQYEAAGHEVSGVDFDLFDFVVPIYYVLTTAEASSNLSRYDGMRYGYRSPNGTDLDSTYKLSRTEGFGTEVQRRIMLGTFVLSSGYYDAYYSQAQRARRLISNQLEAILAEYDFILMPVSPSLPWKIGEQVDDPVANYLADVFTVLANLAGLPAVAIPSAPSPMRQLGSGPQLISRAGGEVKNLPTGHQLMGRKWDEAKLLGFVQRESN